MNKVSVFILLFSSGFALASTKDFNLSQHREFHKETQKKSDVLEPKEKVRISVSNEKAL